MTNATTSSPLEQPKPHVIDYDFGISAVDSGYVRPIMDAVHIVIEGDRAAVVDTGTNDSVELVAAALANVCGASPMPAWWCIPRARAT